MSRTINTLMPLAVLFCLTNASRGGPVLIGATPNGTLYDIDPESGAAAVWRETQPTPPITGLAFVEPNALYLQSGGFGIGGAQLVRMDFPSLNTKLIRDHLPIVASDIEYNRQTGTLLGLALHDASLFTLHPATGNLQVTQTALANSGPLASDAIGRAFAVITGQDFFINPHPHGDDRIVEVDPVTGAILSEWVLDVDMTFASSTFVGDTLMILDQPFGEAGTLYAFDPGLVSLRMIGPVVTDDRIVALAYIPEPATWAVFAIGLAFLVFRRRRTGIVACPLVCLLSIVLLAESGRAEPDPGVTAGQQTELGAPANLIYAGRLQGDFVVGGTSIRTTLPGFSQAEPVEVTIAGIPQGATIVKAFAN